MKLTNEQQAVADHFASGEVQNGYIHAVAGTGKTTTLAALSHNDSLATAFNVRNRKDLEAKLRGECKTLNAIGNTLVQLRRRSHIVKLKDIKAAQQVARDHNSSYHNKLVKQMALAKANVLTEDSPIEAFEHVIPDELCKHSHLTEMLRLTFRDALDNGRITFDDQIWIPARLARLMPTLHYDTLLIDEAQDLTPANIEMLKCIEAKRVWFVGDPMQRIYDFRGAHKDALTFLQNRYNARRFDITINFRCSRAVIANAQQFCHIQAWDGAPEGEVRHERLDCFDINKCRYDTAILCAFNAPLIAMAMRALKQGLPVSLTSKDIIKTVMQQLNRWRNDHLSRGFINEWEDQRLGKAKNDMARNNISDIADICRHLASETSSINEAKNILSALDAESQSTGIYLSTVHKAKGLEWDTVYVLPEKARGDTRNLDYVAATRAQQTLVYLT